MPQSISKGRTVPSELSVKTFCEWYKTHAKRFRKQAESLDRDKMNLTDLVDELDDFVKDYAS